MKTLWQKGEIARCGKHCGKRRNCTFCAISSFVTMFSKTSNFTFCHYVIKSRLMHMRQNVSICGKGLRVMRKALYPILHSLNQASYTLHTMFLILSPTHIPFLTPHAADDFENKV